MNPRKLTHDEIVTERQKNESHRRSPISILLNDVRSLHNVGSIFRLADGIRAEKIYLCGITGRPPDRTITKTALGAERSVPWEYCTSALQAIHQLQSIGHQMVVLEHTDRSAAYWSPAYQFPVCLIVGNEVCGVDREIVSASNCAIQIPMAGEKNSLNVAMAAGIAAYHLYSRLLQTQQTLNLSANHLSPGGL